MSACVEANEVERESFEMSALAIPISLLEPIVVRATEETNSLVRWSRSSVATFRATKHIYIEAFALRRRFANLVNRQDDLLKGLVEKDFSGVRSTDLRELTDKIDSLIRHERDLLDLARSVGSEVRFLWDLSLHRLAEQVEHLDSIAESLHYECDQPEGSALMALAVGTL